MLPRTPTEVLELAFELKREQPARTAGGTGASDHVPGGCAGAGGAHVADAFRRADGRSPDKVYGRFEAAARNELWTGDGLHGPKLNGAARRAVLLAFIDDHSQLLVGWRWGTGEDVIRLEAVLRPGLMARGVPEAILVDRGSAFVSSQLLRACAVLGVELGGSAGGEEPRPRQQAGPATLSKFQRSNVETADPDPQQRNDPERKQRSTSQRSSGSWVWGIAVKSSGPKWTGALCASRSIRALTAVLPFGASPNPHRARNCGNTSPQTGS